WNETQKNASTSELPSELRGVASNPNGFGSLSRRVSIKPIIAAVNGGAYGGGMEILLNCDIVVTEKNAKFALPEVTRGVIAIQGGIPRLAQVAGTQFALEMLLTGRTVTAEEAHTRFRFVNEVVSTTDEVIPTALEFAYRICQNSPDAVQATKKGVLVGNGSHERTVVNHLWDPVHIRTYRGGNIKEGLQAFVEKRLPVWKSPAKL
ncbi:ClpP/crotonase, partial [Pluteus cervinus]